MRIVCADVLAESFPVAGTFTISRGSRREAVVVRVVVRAGDVIGQGECVPYARYGESVQGVIDAIWVRSTLGLSTRAALLTDMPAGAARNGLDCALLDLEAKHQGASSASLLGLMPVNEARVTCFTLSLDAPEAMAQAAAQAGDKPLLKLKLGGGALDAARMQAVRAARPDARLVADANEAWRPEDLGPLLEEARTARLELIEQPLPADADAVLAQIERLVPICADESAHTAADVAHLANRYDAVNIKLDKAGGVTAALAMARAARAAGLKIMTGCMLSTSLAMAPAWLLAEYSDWLDLDGPLLLARDRSPAVVYTNGRMHPPEPAIWG